MKQKWIRLGHVANTESVIENNVKFLADCFYSVITCPTKGTNIIRNMIRTNNEDLSFYQSSAVRIKGTQFVRETLVYNGLHG